MVKSKGIVSRTSPRSQKMGHLKAKTAYKPPSICSSPQQLIVPISIGTWRGKAIVDTGSSYTLMHEYLWVDTPKGSNDDIQPWEEGPLYLANGEAATPLGWGNLTVGLHDKIATLLVAVLGPRSLAYSIVLGLDFISRVGMVISVADKEYNSDPSIFYPFQPGSAQLPHICHETRVNTKMVNDKPV